MAKKHEQAARRITKAWGGEYDPKASPDVKGPGFAVEVKSKAGEVPKAIDQLRRTRGRQKYISLPKPEHETAREYLKGSGIGLVSRDLDITKRSRRELSK